MALDHMRLGTAIHNAIEAMNVQAGAAISAATRETMWQNIAKEIVDEVKNNGEVSAGIPVSTTGTAAAQTGATTAPGSIV